MRVGQPGVETHLVTEHLGGAVGLGGPRRRVAARAALALREVEDAHPVTGPDGRRERPAAGQLDVVSMRRDRQQVDVLVGHGHYPRERGAGSGTQRSAPALRIAPSGTAPRSLLPEIIRISTPQRDRASRLSPPARFRRPRRR